MQLDMSITSLIFYIPHVYFLLNFFNIASKEWATQNIPHIYCHILQKNSIFLCNKPFIYIELQPKYMETLS